MPQTHERDCRISSHPAKTLFTGRQLIFSAAISAFCSVLRGCNLRTNKKSRLVQTQSGILQQQSLQEAPVITSYIEMRCSKSYRLYDLELVDRFYNKVVESVCYSTSL